ncbi:MAG: hypothetical protein GY804_00180 [Alphaproteobacteria bacterium]|nr:hypothetical protein [Alphaproteobacteria bacterium]
MSKFVILQLFLQFIGAMCVAATAVMSTYNAVKNKDVSEKFQKELVDKMTEEYQASNGDTKAIKLLLEREQASYRTLLPKKSSVDFILNQVNKEVKRLNLLDVQIAFPLSRKYEKKWLPVYLYLIELLEKKAKEFKELGYDISIKVNKDFQLFIVQDYGHKGQAPVYNSMVIKLKHSTLKIKLSPANIIEGEFERALWFSLSGTGEHSIEEIFFRAMVSKNDDSAVDSEFKDNITSEINKAVDEAFIFLFTRQKRNEKFDEKFKE